MKITKPSYFQEIQKKAADRWEQLNRDPELAAPWHQLFKQVQSPRHVISELLQNADDAEATEVSIKIVDGIFTFTHNGRDFSADDFASLCRFGYSNKRLLRTIGFRGIGFKSTFSLGDNVELSTPSLSVAFHKKAFTLPIWLDNESRKVEETQIFVRIADDRRQNELANNMQEWLSSPFSLLFFNHIRRLKLGDHDLHWKNISVGPIPNSEWMGLQSQEETPYLIVRSLDQPFPEDALKEIREERLLDLAENTGLPPCKVEIVLGAPGHFFVVLPTGVKTMLPFAMNAPFVQDPARLKIKDPEISPTNRWLLQRIGQLAATATLQWLQRGDLDINERAKAYDLLPARAQKDNSLESACTRVIGEAYMDAIQEKPYVLTNDGHLEMENRCISVPPVLWDIWTSDQIISILSSKVQSPRLLSNSVDQLNQEKLQKYHAILFLERDDFLSILLEQTPPKPKTWSSLLILWKLTSQYWKNKELNLHPVRGKSELYSAKRVVRLGEKKLLQSDEDWDFLANELLVLDVNWLRYLTDQRRIAAETNDKELGEKVDIVDRLLQKTNLHESSNLDTVIELVAKNFFAQNTSKLTDCVRFTQIAAKLNTRIGSAFRFCTRDGVLKPITETLLFDETGKLEEFIPPQYKDYLLLHEWYFQTFISCSKDEWLSWIHSGNSGIKAFIPIAKIPKTISGKQRIEAEVKTRGYAGTLEYRYISSDFRVDDWDFLQDYWKYWEICARENTGFWNDLIAHLLYQSKTWEYAKNAQVFHIARNGSSTAIATLVPGWVIRLRELPCLRDTRGNYRRPMELMRRTPQTEPLLDVEPFVDAHLDFEAARPLLDLLGIRSTPTGPKQIMERLRALAKAPQPPLLELIKWYQRLDSLFDNCSTEDQQEIKSAFHKEHLIFTEDGSWQTTEATFITANENDAPSAALITSSANQLSLWRKIGVNEHPTVELAIEWLKGLPSGEKLSAADARRVKILIGRYPLRVWHTCGHWLNLVGEWVPGKNLQFSLAMQSLVRWTNLHDWVKEQTADLQMLSAELTREDPFSSWYSLASQLEKRTEKPKKTGRHLTLTWLQTLGKILMRIHLDDEIQTARIRTFAARLAETEGQQVERLTVMSYLNGKPAGLPENENLVWMDNIIYITDISKPKLVKQISETISSIVEWSELKVILAYGFERNDQDIRAYLSENFVLDPEEVALPIQDFKVASAPVIADATPAINKGQPAEPASTVIPTQTMGNQAPEGKTPAEVIANSGADESKMPHPPKPPQVRNPLIERFALANGFHKNGSQNFTHSNGNILIKADGVFPWFVQERGGQVLRYYWTKEHCLQAKPLELPTEIWHLIEENPQHHALILENMDGNPVEMSGLDLLSSKESGTLKLFPATYRLTLQFEG